MDIKNECFLCGRKDAALVDGRFSPNLAYEEIQVKYCMECVQQMQEDHEHFFDGLDWAELGRKYVDQWLESKKELKRYDAILNAISRIRYKRMNTGAEEKTGGREQTDRRPE